MPRDDKGHFTKLQMPEVKVEKAELLTVEAHPTIGRIERWRMTDGSIVTVELSLEYVAK